jgi:prevent-host-death family protein
MRLSVEQFKGKMKTVLKEVAERRHLVITKRGKVAFGVVMPIEIVMLELMADEKGEEWERLHAEALAWLERHPEGTVKRGGLAEGDGAAEGGGRDLGVEPEEGPD